MALTAGAKKPFTLPSESVLIRVAALLAALGVALSITDDYASFGKWFAVIGVALLIVGLHRFGRMGPDAPIRFEAAPRKKKRKKKTSSRAAAPDPSAD